MIFHRLSRVAFPSVLLLAACSGSGAKSPSGSTLGAPEVPWGNKTHEERQAYMASTVEPQMRQLFQKFSHAGFASFGCATCHGSDMELVGYRMPNSLPELDGDDPVAGAMDIDEDTTKFMVEKVVPTMAELLHLPAGKPGGVTCFTCHGKE